ncbi:MAG: dephospho-CoA kinase [Candidatus Zixiibacteriota bacterium]
MIVGLTGLIGAGKTTAAREFARLGAAVIDADRIGRDVVDKSAALRRSLMRAFGSDIVDGAGRIRRKQLAALAFADKRSRDKLNEVVHPHLLKELRRQVRNARNYHEIVVIDAALLLQWRLGRLIDFVLVVEASRESRLSRLVARGMSRPDALAREKMQLPRREFIRRADRVIRNNTTTDDLARKIQRLHAQLMRHSN